MHQLIIRKPFSETAECGLEESHLTFGQSHQFSGSANLHKSRFILTLTRTPHIQRERSDNRQGQLREKQCQDCRNGNEYREQRGEPRAPPASGLNWRQGCSHLHSIMRPVSERSSQRTKDREQGFLQRDGWPGHVHPIL
jgi:hypothetical protein